MKKILKAGLTSQTIDVFIQDSSSTVGAGLTGLVYNAASLVCYYRKGATGSATQLSLATQTVGGAYSSGGFVEISSANMPGLYRLDLDNAMIDTAGPVLVMLKGATNMMPCIIELQITAAGIGQLEAAAIYAAAYAADTNNYQAKTGVIDDNNGTTDRYNTVWFKNGQPITTGITSPTIQVIKAADGTDLVASTAMTEIPTSTGLYKYSEGTNRMVDGAAYWIKTQATIDAATRTWYQWIGVPS